MTDTTNTTPLHPMAQEMLKFVNEALTMPELEARTALMANVLAGIQGDIEKLKAPSEEIPEEVGTEEEIPVVEADEIIEFDEERKMRMIAEYAASLEDDYRVTE